MKKFKSNTNSYILLTFTSFPPKWCCFFSNFSMNILPVTWHTLLKNVIIFIREKYNAYDELWNASVLSTLIIGFWTIMSGIIFQFWQNGTWTVVEFTIELVSKELNHFGVIAALFRQIGGHSMYLVDLCPFARFEDFSL